MVADAAAAPGGEPEEVTPAGVQRPHPRPRVRRRRLDAGRATTSSSSSTSPTSASTASGSARSRWRSRRSRRPPAGAALRRHAARPGRRAPSSACARSTARAKPRTRSSRCALDGSGEPTVLASGPRLLLLPPRQPRRRAGSPGPAGTTRTCPGTGPSCGWRRSTTRADARLVAGGPEESVFQPEWDAEGRLHFVSDRDGWWNLYRDEDGAVEQLTAEEAELAPPAVALRRLHLRLPRRRLDRLRPLRARRGTALRCSSPAPSACATSASPTPPSASPRSRRRGTHGRLRRRQPRRARPRSSSTTSPAASWRRCAAPASEPVDPGLRLDPARDRVPDQRRRDRPRLLLPARPTPTSRRRRANCRR